MRVQLPLKQATSLQVNDDDVLQNIVKMLCERRQVGFIVSAIVVAIN